MNIHWIWFLCHYFLLVFWTHKYQLIMFPQDDVSIKIPYNLDSVSWQPHLLSIGMFKYILKKGHQNLSLYSKEGRAFHTLPRNRRYQCTSNVWVWLRQSQVKVCKVWIPPPTASQIPLMSGRVSWIKYVTMHVSTVIYANPKIKQFRTSARTNNQIQTNDIYFKLSLI